MSEQEHKAKAYTHAAIVASILFFIAGATDPEHGIAFVSLLILLALPVFAVWYIFKELA